MSELIKENINNKFEKNAILRRYKEVFHKYDSLGRNLKKALELLLDDNNISYLLVKYRIKKSKDFFEKIRRKKYKKPFEQCEDICGLRIIYYYLSDIKKISRIINKEFVVLDSQDKMERLEPDRFGYRSFHFIVKIKDEWANPPDYRKLKDLKAEIQVRTVLMDAWGEIEHELAYKQDEDIPNQLRRKLSIISAKLEEADGQFDEIRKTSKIYREKLIEKAKEEKIFDKSLRLNIDNLQAFLDLNFPNREKIKNDIVGILNELYSYHITMRDLVELHQEFKNVLPNIEKEMGIMFNDENYKWSQAGCIRALLGIGVYNYYRLEFAGYTNPWAKVLKKWRRKN